MTYLSDARLDDVLRALADPTRRRIYSLLGRQPGLTTGRIASLVPGMSRWGVMKHLGVLREAGLVQTFAEGRRRRHYREPATRFGQLSACVGSPQPSVLERCPRACLYFLARVGSTTLTRQVCWCKCQARPS